MSTLTSLLVRDEVVSVHQIEDALSRQVLEGGEIDTALLELNAAPENTLNAYRAASYGLPPASRADVMDVDRAVVELLPAALAQHHRVVPIGQQGHALVVACAQPLDSMAAREVTAQARGPIEWRVATEVRVEHALAHHYGIIIEPRLRRLAEQVSERPAGDLPHVTPAPAHVLTSRPPPRPAVSVAPVVNVHSAVADARSVDVVASRAALAAPRVPRDVEPKSPGVPRALARKGVLAPKGPITKAEALEQLEVASERDDAVAAFFGYARQYFDSTVLFSVRDNQVHGLEAHALPGVADIHSVTVQVERGSTLDELTRSHLPRVVDLLRKREDQSLASALERQSGQPSALIPVFIRQRLVSLVYGDRSGEPFGVEDITDVVELLPALSQAFERIILVRKALAMRARRASVPPPNPSARASSVPAPRASWSAPAPEVVAPGRPSLPPSAVAGVLASRPSVRPHDAPTPLERHRSVPAAASMTLSGMPQAGPAKHTQTARDMPAVTAGVGPTPTAAKAAEAKRVLSALGAPRSAPPPPLVRRAAEPAADVARATDAAQHASPTHAALERSPTVRLPQTAGAPPPAELADSVREGIEAGATYSSGDTRPLRRSQAPYAPWHEGQGPDSSEPPPASRGEPGMPPVRASKVPPGADGQYRAGEQQSERLGSRPPGPQHPASAQRSSQPPSSYSARDVPPEVVSLPQPGKLPSRPAAASGSAAHAAPTPGTARVSTPPAQRRSERPVAPDARREPKGSAPPTEDMVRMSNALRASLRPPPPAGNEASIIVDTTAQVRQIVDDLCRSGPDDESRAVEALLRFGDEALPVLAEHFPGPLWFDRRKPHPRLPLGRDISAIARGLYAFGDRAWPQLATLLTSRDAEIRFYATLLVSDRQQPALLPLLSERLFDADPQIRLVIKDTLPQYRNVAGFSEVMAHIRERAFDARAPMSDRLAALDAITALRDVASVQPLIVACADHDRQISVPAHRALVVITAQDFGDSARKWAAWYDDHKHQHRVEWLIESLMHSEQTLRATAGLELQKLTQVYYGYVATAPKRDRERAQGRYAAWWQVQGKAKLREGSL